MKKVEYIQHIHGWFEDHDSQLLYCKISQKELIKARYAARSYADLKVQYKWLQELEQAITQWNNILVQHSKETWANLKMINPSMPELLALKDKEKMVRRIWRNRPRFEL